MKLTRSQLLQQNYKIFIQKPDWKRPYQVMFPENVDMETGTVEHWAVAEDEKDVLLQKQQLTATTMVQPLAFGDQQAVLKVTQGKVFILDSDNIIVAESP
jgi:hypothetical protein